MNISILSTILLTLLLTGCGSLFDGEVYDVDCEVYEPFPEQEKEPEVIDQ